MATKTTKISLKKDKAISLWAKYNGHITNICNEVGIARSTFYKWLNNKQFAKSIANEEASISDEMKHRLIKLGKSDNLGAIIYYLRNKHPEFRDKKQTFTVDKMQVNIINYSKKTPLLSEKTQRI